jgi:ABC-2 type transport system permease protein
VDRLVASPSPRTALVAGPTVAAMARSLFTTSILLIAGLIGGIGLPGVGGTLVVYLMAMCFSAATALWAIGVALRTGTVQSTPLMQVVVFLSIFLSVAYAPRETMTGWLRSIADWNPVTYMIEASRAAEVDDLTWADLGPGLLAAALLIAVFATFAGSGLRRLGR